MKKLFSIIVVLFVSLSVNAQKIRFTEMNQDVFKHDNVRGFQYLHEKTYDGFYNWIGNAKITFDTILPNTIESLYAELAHKANLLGGNSFRVNSSDIHSYGKNKFIEVSIYYLNRENYDENRAHFISNSVYIFGFLSYHEKIPGYRVTVNEEKLLVKELQYYAYDLPNKMQMNIKLFNGVGHTELTITGDNRGKAHYIKFNLIQRTFAKGIIREHKWSFGEFLIRIMDRHDLVLNSLD